jgi:hypothetical protein
MDHQSSDPSDMRIGPTHMVIPVALFNRMANAYYGNNPSPDGEGERQVIREPQKERELSEGKAVEKEDLQMGPGFGSVMWPEGDPEWERVKSDAE